MVAELQVYTEHIERLLMQANRRLKLFEEAWAAKQKELEKVLDGSSVTKHPSPQLDKVALYMSYNATSV